MSLRVRDGEVWRATLTPEGPATVHLVQKNGEVEVEAWGPGAGWATAGAAQLCGEEDDDSGFRPLHPLIAESLRRHPGLRLPKTRSVFEALVPVVLGQKVTSVEAHQSYRTLVDALGEPAPGPFGLAVPPSAAVLARTPYWTAAKVALVALGDPDAVQVGDYHLPHIVAYALEGKARSTDERMLELLEPYRGHRARAVRLIGLTGIGAPRFGPRMPLRNITRS